MKHENCTHPAGIITPLLHDLKEKQAEQLAAQLEGIIARGTDVLACANPALQYKVIECSWCRRPRRRWWQRRQSE